MTFGQAAANDTSSLLFTAPVKGKVTLRNQGPNTVELGAAGFAYGAGFPLAINETVEVNVKEGEVIHADCAAAETATVGYVFSSAW